MIDNRMDWIQKDIPLTASDSTEGDRLSCAHADGYDLGFKDGYEAAKRQAVEQYHMKQMVGV